MNDTHGEKGEGWYGFDLDGTLAKYDGWKGIDHIGEPVKPMVDLMKRMHDEGKVVKIMTARVAPKEKPETKPNPFLGRLNPEYAEQYVEDQGDPPSGFYSLTVWGSREFVSDWCLRELGFLPPIVYQKDHLMLNLFDDRVTQVEPNTGRILGRLPPELDRFSWRRGRYVVKTCPRCGREQLMYSSAKRCAECRAELAKEANRRSYVRRAMRG